MTPFSDHVGAIVTVSHVFPPPPFLFSSWQQEEKGLQQVGKKQSPARYVIDFLSAENQLLLV